MSMWPQYIRTNNTHFPSCERQDILCVRPKQANWISAEGSFR